MLQKNSIFYKKQVYLLVEIWGCENGSGGYGAGRRENEGSG
jgi:hypothetical protein